MTETHVHTTYSFDELSEEAQENAIEKNYDWNVDDSFWSEFTIQDLSLIHI